MNLAAFEQNKPLVLGAAAAGVAGLALWQKKKRTAGAPTVTAGAAPVIAGTSPAAAVVPAGSYDSSSYDLYNALQPEIDQILAQQRTAGAGAITTAPAPGASSLFAPTYSGNYVRFADGQIDEVEGDGSLLWLNPQENAKAASMAGGSSDWVHQLTVNAPTNGAVYNTGTNLLTAQSQFAPKG